MDEYTFKDLIIDPETPGLRSLIGKEVYYCDVPIYCIRYANDDYKVGILKDIRKGESAPFKVMTPGGFLLCYSCIILKKEAPKPEYTPFKSMEEFIDKYSEVMKGVDYDSFEDGILYWGMWLKYIDDTDKPVYILVHEIKDEGVKLDERGRFTWEELLSKGFLFPNNTPCGKLKENK